MFKGLTQNFVKIFDKLRGSGILTEAQIDEVVRDIKRALLDADVALVVVKDFIESVRIKAKGQDIVKSVSPGQMVIKIIHDELVSILSTNIPSATLPSKKVSSYLLVGLQGSGKTTLSAKLALKLKNDYRKILLVSLDTYRPAAQEQLAILGSSIEIDTLPIIEAQAPLQIAHRALAKAKEQNYDLVIYDSAGRLHIDDLMLNEIVDLKKLIEPSEIILTIDSMIGQDAVKVAQDFDARLNVTALALTKIDGDTRGGAALSVVYTTKKPIKFLSNGEKLVDLEQFDPVRLADRILDKGDIVNLVEKAASLIDKQEAEAMSVKLQKGKFDLEDYLNQLKSINKLGGLQSIMGMLPGMNKMMNNIDANKIDEKLLSQQEAIILSMTKKERKNPDILNASRRLRIANGSGTSVQKINNLMKQFLKISDLMKKASKMGMSSLMSKGLGKLFS